jgi:hypothetical protein
MTTGKQVGKSKKCKYFDPSSPLHCSAKAHNVCVNTDLCVCVQASVMFCHITTNRHKHSFESTVPLANLMPVLTKTLLAFKAPYTLDSRAFDSK